MRLTHLRNIVGFNLVGLHILAIGLVFYLVQPLVSTEEFQVIVLILIPVTGLYAMSFVRFASRNMMKTPATNAEVTVQFAVLSTIITFGYSILIIYLVCSFATSQNITPEAFKMRLALGEVIGGGALGLIIEGLFPGAAPASADQPAPVAGAESTEKPAPASVE